MIKDKEWLKEEISEKFNYALSAGKIEQNYYEQTTEMLFSLIDQLEKPIIPQFVADWIEEHKDKFNLRGALGVFTSNDLIKNYYNQKVYEWLRYTKEDGKIVWNDETFALAWINGYEIEKEKLYYLEFPNDHFKGVCLTIDYNGAKCLHGKVYSKTMGYKNTFTESELLGMDETGFIRVEVME